MENELEKAEAKRSLQNAREELDYVNGYSHGFAKYTLSGAVIGGAIVSIGTLAANYAVSKMGYSLDTRSIFEISAAGTLFGGLMGLEKYSKKLWNRWDKAKNKSSGLEQ